MAEAIRDFLGENARLIASFILLFMLFIPIGVVCYHAYPSISSLVIQYTKMKASKTAALAANKPVLRALLIFRNNAKVVATMVSLGITGIVPVAIIAGNGLVLGMIVEYVRASGLGITAVILSIVPHGIIEVPGICIAAAGGFRWFLEIVKGKGSFSERLVRGLRSAVVGFLISLLLLAIAALVEAYITPPAHANVVHA